MDLCAWLCVLWQLRQYLLTFQLTALQYPVMMIAHLRMKHANPSMHYRRTDRSHHCWRLESMDPMYYKLVAMSVTSMPALVICDGCLILHPA